MLARGAAARRRLLLQARGAALPVGCLRDAPELPCPPAGEPLPHRLCCLCRPGYVSVYLQISDPGNSSSKWDCFASYRLSVRNLADDTKSVHRDSWHRFSAKKKSHGARARACVRHAGQAAAAGRGGGRRGTRRRAEGALLRSGGPAGRCGGPVGTEAAAQWQRWQRWEPGAGRGGAAGRPRARPAPLPRRRSRPRRPLAPAPRAGWCDFAALSTVLDAKQGFLGPGDTVTVSTDITILHESVSFSRESDLSGAAPSATGDVYSGKFVWRVHNFSAFQPLLKTQKIMSPGFPAGAARRGGGRGGARAGPGRGQGGARARQRSLCVSQLPVHGAAARTLHQARRCSSCGSAGCCCGQAWRWAQPSLAGSAAAEPALGFGPWSGGTLSPPDSPACLPPARCAR